MAWREALEAYRWAGKDPIIQNLQSQIDFASDPFIRLNLLTAAQLTEEICGLDPLVKERRGGAGRPGSAEHA